MMKWRRREEVIGKEVINSDAMKLGVTKDLAWSSDGHLALVIESPKKMSVFFHSTTLRRSAMLYS